MEVVLEKENSWFMPMKLITEPGERNDKYLDFISEQLGNGIGDKNAPNAPKNIEAYTYIPDTVVIKGVKCKVTEFATGAFAENKKLTNVTIGKYVTKIGKQAFYKSAKLKKVTIKSTGVKSIGSKAFQGIYKKAVIKTPKSKKSAYKKLLKNKMAKSVKVK